MSRSDNEIPQVLYPLLTYPGEETLAEDCNLTFKLKERTFALYPVRMRY